MPEGWLLDARYLRLQNKGDWVGSAAALERLILHYEAIPSGVWEDIVSGDLVFEFIAEYLNSQCHTI